MLKDNINFGDVNEHVKGHVTVELFDAKTGKLVHKQEKHNYIAHKGVEYLQYLQRQNFKDQVSALAGASADTDSGTYNPFEAIVLTDSSEPEDPVNGSFMPGIHIGWANKSTYSGPDVYRGTPNASLCESTESYTKWVYDWPTHAALGTIGSVGWAKYPERLYYNIANSHYSPQVHNLTSFDHDNSYSSPVGVRPIARTASGEIYAGTSTSTSRYDSTMTSITSFTTIDVRGLAWDEVNSKLWVISNTEIASYDNSGSIVDAPTAITNRTYNGLSYDGTDLWTTSGSEVYQINTSGGDVSNFTISSNIFAGTAQTLYDIAYEATSGLLYVLVAGNGDGSGPIWSVKAHDSSGNLVHSDISMNPYFYDSRNYRSSQSSNMRIDFINSNTVQVLYYNLGFDIAAGNYLAQFRLDGIGSRSVLDTPITKTNAQSLRITYQMDYV